MGVPITAFSAPHFSDSVMVDLILGSGSPRRAALLQQIGLSTRIEPPDVDESIQRGESAEAYVQRICGLKFAAVGHKIAADTTQEVVLCADTTVVLDGTILGKPRDKQDACDMLQNLSGRVHKVLTAVKLGRWPESADQRAFCVEKALLYGGTQNPG